MNYEIIVDVACDISDEIAKLYNIHFIPMSYSFGDQMLVCDGNDSDDKLIASPSFLNRRNTMKKFAYTLPK